MTKTKTDVQTETTVGKDTGLSSKKIADAAIKGCPDMDSSDLTGAAYKDFLARTATVMARIKNRLLPELVEQHNAYVKENGGAARARFRVTLTPSVISEDDTERVQLFEFAVRILCGKFGLPGEAPMFRYKAVTAVCYNTRQAGKKQAWISTNELVNQHKAAHRSTAKVPAELLVPASKEDMEGLGF